jgi:2-polyprenyl-6-methoxyphenol hydroxylase-like FAD-dependent oxidoreductase
LTNKTILISGAGIAGPTLAYWLSRHGFTPTVIEWAPVLRTGGYIMDFWGVGFDVAERMHLIPRLKHAGYDAREVRIVDDSGRRIGGFCTNRLRRALCDRFFSIPRGDLSKNIYETVEAQVETVFGDSVRTLQEDQSGVAVEFDHSPPRRFDLVIGADGLHSAVRKLVFGPESSFATYLGYCAASFPVDGYPHRNDSVYVAHSRPGKQVARFALRDGRTVFFVIFAAPDIPAVAHHDTDAQKALLCQILGDMGWECPEILKALDCVDELYFDSVTQVRLSQWHRGRIALVGDAAFCPSLLAGEGSSLAMAGAYLLAGELRDAGEDFRAAYSAYQRRFKRFIERKQRLAARFSRQFAPRTRLGLLVRNVASQLLDVPLVGDMMAKRMFADRFVMPDYS